jgi:hypothetical protein
MTKSTLCLARLDAARQVKDAVEKGMGLAGRTAGAAAAVRALEASGRITVKKKNRGKTFELGGKTHEFKQGGNLPEGLSVVTAKGLGLEGHKLGAFNAYQKVFYHVCIGSGEVCQWFKDGKVNCLLISDKLKPMWQQVIRATTAEHLVKLHSAMFKCKWPGTSIPPCCAP